MVNIRRNLNGCCVSVSQYSRYDDGEPLHMHSVCQPVSLKGAVTSLHLLRLLKNKYYFICFIAALSNIRHGIHSFRQKCTSTWMVIDSTVKPTILNIARRCSHRGSNRREKNTVAYILSYDRSVVYVCGLILTM